MVLGPLGVTDVHMHVLEIWHACNDCYCVPAYVPYGCVHMHAVGIWHISALKPQTWARMQ